MSVDGGNAAHRLRLGAAIAAEGGDAQPHFLAAAALNPGDAGILIDLGLDAETKGDFGAAERFLLRAAGVSKRYLPRWTLANFHYRRGSAKFWESAGSAFAMSYGDARPLFALCWAARPDAGFILDRALPNRPEILRQFVPYLIAKGAAIEGVRVSEALAEMAAMEDRPALLAHIDALIAGAHHHAALSLWKLVVRRGLLPHMAEHGISNGEFLQPPVRSGFDWRPGAAAGLHIAFAPRSCRISFTGKQPEACDLLSQYVPVKPATKYWLNVEAEFREIPLNAGVNWTVFDAQNNSELGGAQFETGPATRFARVVLRYRRPLGMTRIEGTMELKRVELKEAR